jgi:hypothetical protein
VYFSPEKILSVKPVMRQSTIPLSHVGLSNTSSSDSDTALRDSSEQFEREKQG